MNRTSGKRVLVVAVCAALGAGALRLAGGASAAAAGGTDWPQWRGPNRDAVGGSTGLKHSWEGSPPKLAWQAAVLAIPNLAHDDAPAGGEEDYTVLETIGTPRDFAAEGFEPRDHVELGRMLGAIETAGLAFNLGFQEGPRIHPHVEGMPTLLGDLDLIGVAPLYLFAAGQLDLASLGRVIHQRTIQILLRGGCLQFLVAERLDFVPV